MTIEDSIKKGLESYEICYDRHILQDLCTYVQEIKKWNEHINLTGFKDTESLIKGLLYDAFFVYTFMDKESSILDMGSGAGIISIPTGIINRGMEVFSVDKNTKKIHFQRHIKRLLGLERFHPLRERIESIKDISVDIVTAKGFGRIEDILCKGANILKKGGKVLILKGKNDKPVEFNGFDLVGDIVYSLTDSEKIYRLFIYSRDMGF